MLAKYGLLTLALVVLGVASSRMHKDRRAYGMTISQIHREQAFRRLSLGTSLLAIAGMLLMALAVWYTITQ